MVRPLLAGVVLLAAAGCATAPPPPTPRTPFLGLWRGTQGSTVQAVYRIDEKDGRLRVRSEYRILNPSQPGGQRAEGEAGGIRIDGQAISFTVVYDGGGPPVDRSMAVYDLVAEGDTLRGRGQNLRTNAVFDVQLERVRR